MNFNDFEQYIDRSQLSKTDNGTPLGAPPQETQPYQNSNNNNQGGYQKKQWNNNNQGGGYQKKPWNSNNNNQGGGYQKKQWNNNNQGGGYKKPWERNNDQVVSNLNPNDDGITHINMYTKSNNQLGRDLSHFANIGFTHPIFGTFMSIEGFWYWISTGMKDDILKGAYGFRAKKLGKELEKTNLPVEEFKKHIADAHRLRLEQNFGLRKQLIDSTLPFEHYYYFGDPPKVQLANGQWIKEIVEDLRRKFKAEYQVGKAEN